ncbi:MAG: HAD family hydrolase [Oscillospiraceae bacterium]|nr:HAD family hydrolase [Oscillospiraceae bacterium]
MKYDKTLLITDADGTLLNDDKRVLAVDRAAITEFTQGGGLFTIATGRGIALARAVAEEIGMGLLNAPAVIFNGAMVYDFASKRTLWKSTLQQAGIDYIEKLIGQFPHIGTEILIDEKIYVTCTNAYEEEHLLFGNVNPIRCKFDELSHDGWIKAVFVDEPEHINEMIAFAEANPCDAVHAVSSAPMFFEILPRGVNKGTGFKKMLEIMGYGDYKVFAAGDYMNDLEMLRMADFAFAAGNAENVVKQAADKVVCDNNSGVIREVVDYMGRIKG